MAASTADDDLSIRLRVSDGLGSTGLARQVHGDTLTLDATCSVLISNFCRADYTIRACEVTASWCTAVTATSRSTGPTAPSTCRPTTATSGRVHSAAAFRAGSGHGDVDLLSTRYRSTWTAQSSHGDVTLAVPDFSSGYRVLASSDEESVDTRVRTDPQSDRVISAHSDHGDVAVLVRARSERQSAATMIPHRHAVWIVSTFCGLSPTV